MSIGFRTEERYRYWHYQEPFPILNKAAICAVVMMVALHVFKAIIPAVGAVIFFGIIVRRLTNEVKLNMWTAARDVVICFVIVKIAGSIFKRYDIAETVALLGVGNRVLDMIVCLNKIRVELARYRAVEAH